MCLLLPIAFGWVEKEVGNVQLAQSRNQMQMKRKLGLGKKKKKRRGGSLSVIGREK